MHYSVCLTITMQPHVGKCDLIITADVKQLECPDHLVFLQDQISSVNLLPFCD